MFSFVRVNRLDFAYVVKHLGTQSLVIDLLLFLVEIRKFHSLQIVQNTTIVKKL